MRVANVILLSTLSALTAYSLERPPAPPQNSAPGQSSKSTAKKAESSGSRRQSRMQQRDREMDKAMVKRAKAYKSR